MKNTTEHHWFIDAWAVIDGYAFASLRPPESIAAAVTLFLAPPYFEPEPVASLATALAATRGHFQEGFHDANGAEVAFGSLSQVVEAVRRGYRAGGLDVSGTPLPTIPAPREPGGAGAAVHPAELVDNEMLTIWPMLRDALLDNHSTGPTREQHLRSLLAQLLESVLQALVPKFVGYATVSMLAELSDDGPGRSTRARQACAWIDRARGLGVQVNIAQRPARVTASLMGSPQAFEWIVPELDALPRTFLETTHPLFYRTNGALVSEVHVPFTVPIPAIFQAETGTFHYPPIPTLGHLMAAATADRKYVAALDAVHEIVPLLVLALTQLPSAALPYPGLPRFRGTPECSELSESAAAWLARALPSGTLSGHPAEEALHELVRALLRPSNEDDEGTPAPLNPDPGPHLRGPSVAEPYREPVRQLTYGAPVAQA